MTEEYRSLDKNEAPKPMLATDMASLRTQFMLLVNEFLLKWCDEVIHSVVRENAERTKALGESGLHQMKTEYEEFVKNLPSEVEKVFALKKCWLPLQNSGELFIKKEPDRGLTFEQLNHQLSDGIRDVQGKLGSFLMKYKFSSAWESKWSVDDEDRTGHLRFKSKFIFTKEMTTILERYIELYNQVEAQLQQESEKKCEELEGEAEDSWDRA